MWNSYKGRGLNFTNREETQFHLRVELAIKSHIQQTYGVIVRREWYILLDNEDHIIDIPKEHISDAQRKRKESYRNPDLLWWDNGLWILEVDGYIHHLKSGKTATRNKIYENNNVKFITVDTYEMGDKRVQNRKIENIIKDVDMEIESARLVS